MRHTDDVSLWPWPLTLKLVRNVAQLFVVDLWAIGRGRASTDVSGRGETSSLSIDPAAATVCCLHGQNWQITGFRRQNSRFRKRSSKIGLSCNIAVPHENTACEFGANWYGNGREIRQPAVLGKFALEDMPQDVCQINGLGDLDLWLFDLETGVRVASKAGNLQSEFGHSRPLGSRVIRYVLPLLYGRGHNNAVSDITTT